MHNVDDLVSVVPYLIGFHPEESLVVMMLEQGRVAVTARVDLAAVRGAEGLAALLGKLFERFPAAEAWFLAFTDDDVLAWELLAECVEVVGSARLGRVLQVASGYWRADFPDGPTGSISGEVSVAAAEAAVLGLPARSSRRDLRLGIAGPPPGELARLGTEFAARSAELEALGPRGRRRLLRRLLRTPAHCRLEDCVRLALLADRLEGQVAMLRTLCRENADQQLELWTQVVRHSPDDVRPAVLGLLGMAAWQTGDGALQVVCLEELDLMDASAPIAILLDLLNTNVVPPDHWRAVREHLLELLAVASGS